MQHRTDYPRSDHQVALVKCGSYDRVAEALCHGINLLGGLEKYCSPGELLLLKPNLLLGDKPEKGSTTHPLFFQAVAELFKSGGTRMVYGDSPGFGSPQAAVQTSGLKTIAESLGLELSDFLNVMQVSNPDGILLKQFNLAKGLRGVDGVINLPKLKTHGLTRLTGAVKNLFGCLPGVQKASFHASLKDPSRFSKMLVDLAEHISPRLNIMDGILGMEGNGPRNGRLRQVGIVLLSTNPHAMDHCVAQIMNLKPDLVPTLRVARENGLYHPEAIRILGDSLGDCVLPDFDVNRSLASVTGSQRLHLKLLKRWVTPHPALIPDKCSCCGRCVKVCPVNPKAVRFSNGFRQPPQFDYHDCVRCYCCQEMCPDAAIIIKTPMLGKIANHLKL